MAGEDITVIQTCGVCRAETGSFSVKKENLMLSSRARIWCDKCQTATPERRDIAGRLDSIRKEVDSLPPAGSR